MTIKAGSDITLGTLGGLFDTLINASTGTLSVTGITANLAGSPVQAGSTGALTTFLPGGGLVLTGTISCEFKRAGSVTGYAINKTEPSGTNFYTTALRAWELEIVYPVLETGTYATDSDGREWAVAIHDSNYTFGGSFDHALDDGHDDWEDLIPHAPSESGESIIARMTDDTIDNTFAGSIIRSGGTFSSIQRQVATYAEPFQGTGQLTVAGTDNIFGVTESGAALPAADPGALAFTLGGAVEISGTMLHPRIRIQAPNNDVIRVDVDYRSAGAVTIPSSS